ncbi:WGR domain-containing protein [Methylicorpusculum sp.]|uniref:WGR domain-containing protein n=1 Tax=Methylicorpusculum sp. TaxID=2713644 RepID=UPI0027250E5F|nr:WGR domain-containing protein [Methylicorpusculum sp.]MDO8845341.1 WGR domain-containing protein [Methylicorpusculum sp.]
MTQAYLVRHNDLENMHRYYTMTISPGIFGDWSLVRQWGRIGHPGMVKKDWFPSPEQALDAGAKIEEAKRKKGYDVISSFGQNKATS